MNARSLRFDDPVTLVGNGALTPSMLEQARAVAPVMVAADGAADRLAEWGQRPVAVIGDMDSIRHPEEWQEAGVTFLHIREQETTDFEKCLYSVSAPFFVAAGFTGRRIDHTLAVLHAMLRRPHTPTFLVGEVEAIAMLPTRREVSVTVEPGAIVSLFPVLPGRGLASDGLQWPIADLEFAAGGLIGTSNRATAERVTVSVDGDGIMFAVPRKFLANLINAVLSARHRS